MYYGCEIWGCTSDIYIQKLEQIIIDGMRIVTGATAGSSIVNLFTETAWHTFADNRDRAILVMMYKTHHGMVPAYLQEIMPGQNQDFIQYNLRNKENIAVPCAKKNALKKSFVHSGVSLWNSLPLTTRQKPSLSAFRMELKKTNNPKNVLYYYGSRWPSIMHSRMRVGCSKLNYDLFFNLHIPDINPSCQCGFYIEDVKHFFLDCPLYRNIRENLKIKVELLTNFNIDSLLYGSPRLTLDQNKLVFDAVHEYIVESGRFVYAV